jgi:hypothetical protein
VAVASVAAGVVAAVAAVLLPVALLLKVVLPLRLQRLALLRRLVARLLPVVLLREAAVADVVAVVVG